MCYIPIAFLLGIGCLFIFWSVIEGQIEEFVQNKINAGKQKEVVGFSFVMLLVIVLREKY